jgi:hypothetical protein
VSRPRKRDKPKRPPESYRGRTPEARAAQAANLRPAPPAPEGNQLARTHGGYVSRVDPDRVDLQVQRLATWLVEDPPLRAPDGSLPREDRLLLELLAMTLVRLADVKHFLNLHGVLDEKGVPRAAGVLERELSREATGLADRLLMSTAARVKAGLEVAETTTLLSGAAGRPEQFAVFDTDPGVLAAKRALVRAAGRAREAELGEADDPPPAIGKDL